jgi:clan AA aspartic protease (TIGR02281 family)
VGTPVKVAVACVVLVGIALSNIDVPRPSGGENPGPPVLPNDNLPRSTHPKPNAANFYADGSGQFWIECHVNGRPMRFLADTGADTISLSRRDASRLGVDVKSLTFDGRASTANGTVRTAQARIDRFSVGPFDLTDVPVLILDGEMDGGLLGMSFLQRMNVSISNGMLTLSSKP